MLLEIGGTLEIGIGVGRQVEVPVDKFRWTNRWRLSSSIFVWNCCLDGAQVCRPKRRSKPPWWLPGYSQNETRLSGVSQGTTNVRRRFFVLEPSSWWVGNTTESGTESIVDYCFRSQRGLELHSEHPTDRFCEQSGLLIVAGNRGLQQFKTQQPHEDKDCYAGQHEDRRKWSPGSRFDRSFDDH